MKWTKEEKQKLYSETSIKREWRRRKINIFGLILIYARGSLVVKALGYKPEDCGFETNEVKFQIYLILPAALGPGAYSILTEMNTWNIKKIMFLVSKVRPVRGADNLTAIYELIA
jgi:hypothetical protein